MRGQPLVARALLDAETRALSLAALCGGTLGRDATVAVAGGVLIAELDGEWSEDTPRLVEGVRGARRSRSPAGGIGRRRGAAVEGRADRSPAARAPARARDARGRGACARCDREGAAPRVRRPGPRPPPSGGAPLRRQGRAPHAARARRAPATSPTRCRRRRSTSSVAGSRSTTCARSLASAPRGRPKTDLAVVRALARGGRAVVAPLVAALPRFDDDAVVAAAEVLQDDRGSPARRTR